MAPYQWTPVAAPTAGAMNERPRCWGKEFNDSARECRGCGYQNSCKEEIIRLNNSRAVAPYTPPAYYTPGQPQVAPYQPPTHVPVYQPPIPQAPPQVARSVQVPAMPPQPQPMMPARTVQPIHPTPQNYGYGWIQDPLSYTIASVPTPMRPQMPGETFMERAAKNTALAMAETFFGQCMLAVRQFVWAPTPPGQPPNGQK